MYRPKDLALFFLHCKVIHPALFISCFFNLLSLLLYIIICFFMLSPKILLVLMLKKKKHLLCIPIYTYVTVIKAITTGFSRCLTLCCRLYAFIDNGTAALAVSARSAIADVAPQWGFFFLRSHLAGWWRVDLCSRSLTRHSWLPRPGQIVPPLLESRKPNMFFTAVFFHFEKCFRLEWLCYHVTQAIDPPPIPPTTTNQTANTMSWKIRASLHLC